MRKVIVVGGGAAGMMAALAAADQGCRVCLIEKNEKLGKKLFITGKGRCNVTNAADMETLFANVRSNGKFLYSAFYDFDNRAVMDFLEKAGCPLKTERGERVFPVSDHSSDVIAAFQRELKKRKVEILLHTAVKELILEEPEEPRADDRLPKDSMGRHLDREEKKSGAAWDTDVTGMQSAAVREAGAAGAGRRGKKGKAETVCRKITGVRLADGRTLSADGCIVCTGGISYPSTGSTGDGYGFAEKTGHQVTDRRPSLVPFHIKEKWCSRVMGLALKNVSLRMDCDGKTCYEGFGEMLFTHFGVSGPLILSASSFYEGTGKTGKPKETKLYIDLKPALDLEQLDRRLLRDLETNKGKQFKNALGGLFPASLIPVMVELSGIHPDKKVNEVTREERRRFGALIKKLPLTVTGLRGFEEAIITRGGVSIKDVNPSTMESKKVQGLYFAGEVLDVDALTGGYNLQIAWSTGHLAGSSQKNHL